MKLSKSYFQNPDVIFLAKDLIGKKLCTKKNWNFVSAIISETEAYKWIWDAACHWRIKTPRTKVMHWEGWYVYTYLCYGLHVLFNIVTNKKDFADAILIRSILPVQWEEIMLKNVNKKSWYKFDWPGKVAKWLWIDMKDYWKDLETWNIWVEEYIKIDEKDIGITPRIGIDYAWQDALLPWRFIISDKDIKKYL